MFIYEGNEFIYESNDENIPAATEAYYEAIASQEEKYLEETEEQLRMILTWDDPSPSQTDGPQSTTRRRR